MGKKNMYVHIEKCIYKYNFDTPVTGRIHDFDVILGSAVRLLADDLSAKVL